MKKTILLLSVALVLFLGCSCIVSTKTEAATVLSLTNLAKNELSQTFTKKPQNPSSTDSVIALLLYPHIVKAVNNYFGEPTQIALYDAKVNNISQIGTDFAYKVTISVPTFHGPHNPPYGLEKMTFTIEPGRITLDKYEHKDVAP